jgi:hypothetical protein
MHFDYFKTLTVQVGIEPLNKYCTGLYGSVLRDRSNYKYRLFYEELTCTYYSVIEVNVTRDIIDPKS